MFRTVYLVTVVVMAATAARAQVNVTVTPGVEMQTIEGFGAHGAADVWWSGGPFYTNTFGDIVIDDLGFTMIRNEFYPDFEPSNENTDPNSLNMSAFNYSGIFGSKQKNYLTSMKNKAAASGEPIRFIATYWTPPKWLKVNNSEVGGDAATNRLRPLASAYNELGEYGVATARAYKEQCGIDLYALSMQNEPAFDEPYNSCVYTPDEYVAAFRVFGPAVHAAYPDVKLFGAEHMLIHWGTFEGRLNQDTLSRRHIDRFAVHGYSDGVHPTANTAMVNKWKQAASNSRPSGKTVWMTETSGYFETWDDCMQVAEAIYAGLKYGNMSAWVWWQLGGGSVLNEYNLMRSDAAGMRAYIHKHYARYIRPDAVHIASTSSDTLLFAAAFHHKQHHTLTVVLINATGGQKSVTIAGDDIPSFSVYRSTASERCVSAGTVSNATLTMPASSVVTLYGSNYNPVTATRHPTGASRCGRAGPGVQGRVYHLDGRVSRGEPGRSHAVRVVESRVGTATLTQPSLR